MTAVEMCCIVKIVEDYTRAAVSRAIISIPIGYARWEPCFDLTCEGEMNSPLRQGFACGKTLVRRKVPPHFVGSHEELMM